MNKRAVATILFASLMVTQVYSSPIVAMADEYDNLGENQLSIESIEDSFDTMEESNEESYEETFYETLEESEDSKVLYYAKYFKMAQEEATGWTITESKDNPLAINSVSDYKTLLEYKKYINTTEDALERTRGLKLGQYIELKTDLDLKNVELESIPVTSFDGNNHKISNIKLNIKEKNTINSATDGYFGLFSTATIVSNLTVENADITVVDGFEGGSIYIGTIIGYGELQNCQVKGTVNIKIGAAKAKQLDLRIGGMSGHSGPRGNYSKCTQYADVNVDFSSLSMPDSNNNKICVGGVAGVIYDSKTYKGGDHLYLNGKLNVTDGTYDYSKCNMYVGGVVGESLDSLEYLETKKGAEVNLTYANEYTRHNIYVGGIAGHLSGLVNKEAKLFECYNRGSVKGFENVAGIAAKSTMNTEYCVNEGPLDTNIPADKNDFSVNIGGIFADFSGANSGAMIKLCENTYDIKTAYKNANIAGIATKTAGTTISKCVNKGNLEGINSVAGFVYQTGSSVVIEECVNQGNITATGDENESIYGKASGFVVTQNSGDLTIQDSTNSGNISASNGYASGFGRTIESIYVKNCKNTGAVSGDQASGFFNELSTSLSDILPTMTGCANTGKIKGTAEAAGLVNTMKSGKIEKCFNTGEISADKITAGLIGIISSTNATYICDCFNCGKVYQIDETSNGTIPCSGLIGYLNAYTDTNNVVSKVYFSLNRCYNVGAVAPIKDEYDKKYGNQIVHSMFYYCQNDGESEVKGNDIYYFSYDGANSINTDKMKGDHFTLNYSEVAKTDDDLKAVYSGNDCSEIWGHGNSGYPYPYLIGVFEDALPAEFDHAKEVADLSSAIENSKKEKEDKKEDEKKDEPTDDSLEKPNIPVDVPSSAPVVDPETKKNVEEAAANRENVKTKPDGETTIKQSYYDTVSLIEKWLKGRIKKYTIVVPSVSANSVITLNAGGKFYLESDDINYDKRKGEVTVFTIKKDQVSFNGASVDIDKAYKVISKTINKKGVLTPKIIKGTDRKEVSSYSYTISYTGTTGMQHNLIVNVITPNVKIGVFAKKDNLTLYSVPNNGKEGKRLIDYRSRIDSNEAKVEYRIKEKGVATYGFCIPNTETVNSGIWTIGKTVLKPGVVTLVGHKNENDGKDYAAVVLSEDATMIYVTPIYNTKGNFKATLDLNGKKYNISIKIKK